MLVREGRTRLTHRGDVGQTYGFKYVQVRDKGLSGEDGVGFVGVGFVGVVVVVVVVVGWRGVGGGGGGFDRTNCPSVKVNTGEERSVVEFTKNALQRRLKGRG